MPKGRILAIDDQRYFRELLEGLLTEEGFEVQTAASGEEALRILDHASFDIVLTDLVMPGMDGNELVHRVKQRDPDQDLVVVTGVVDVKTAVEAMKLGASEYLLKPFDRDTLATSLETVLQRTRLRKEHDRLLAENIEFMGERSLVARATQLFSVIALDPLAERIADGLCVETNSQAGVLWIARGAGSDLALATARGLVRMADEPDRLALETIPEQILAGERLVVTSWGSRDDEEPRPSICLALRREGRIVGFAQLADKLGGEAFDSIDTSCAEKFAGFAEVALSNALRFAALERGSLEDPASGAYVFEYLQGVVRTEIEKSSRHGRGFALVKADFGSLSGIRQRVGEAEFRLWLRDIVALLQGSLRGTDVLASDSEGQFLVLLPEADAIGAAVLKQRVAAGLTQSGLLDAVEEPHRPEPRLAVATYPHDGTQLESLLRVLDDRIAEERRSPVESLGLGTLSFGESLERLLSRGESERPEVVDDLARFVLAEVGRLPRERGLLFVAPGEALFESVVAGLEGLRGIGTRTEIVVLSDGDAPEGAEPSVTWVRPPHHLTPFLLHFGDGPAYALVRDQGVDGDATRLYHTNDRSVVEHLTFRLQRELAVPALM